jgi:hypothetical protein
MAKPQPSGLKKRYRDHGDDGISWDKINKCYVGTISLGFKDGKRVRRTVRGKTKAEVKDNLDKVHDEINAGIRTPATYTIEQCVKDWLDSIERDPHTMATLHSQAKKWIYPKIGSTKLKDFNATDADRFFKELGKVLSKRSLMMIKRRSGDPFAERKFTTSSAGTLSSWLTSQPVSQATHHAP